MKFLGFVFVCLVVIAGTVVGVGAASSEADFDCDRSKLYPDAGTIALAYLRASTQNEDRNDYRLSGTLRWDNPKALDCFAKKGHAPQAYEHEIIYQKHFDRKIWNEDFSAFPPGAEIYIDTTVRDQGDITGLAFGILRPEKLSAGVDYAFSFETFLPNHPPDAVHRIRLSGSIDDRNCPWASTWCVGLKGDGDKSGAFVGDHGLFAVRGTTCWSWRRGQTPTACSPTATPPPIQPVAPETPEAASRPSRPPPLKLSLSEDPFRCDGTSRQLGRLSGALPNDTITFRSPQATGLLPGQAASDGTLDLRWMCSPGEDGAVELSATPPPAGRVRSRSPPTHRPLRPHSPPARRHP